MDHIDPTPGDRLVALLVVLAVILMGLSPY